MEHKMINAVSGEKPTSIMVKLTATKCAYAAFMVAGAALCCAAFLAASTAKAQTSPSYANQFSQPYGSSSSAMMTPYDARTRDLNANRVVVDGVIMTGDDLSNLPLGIYNSASSGLGYSGVSGYAIGNQLNVTTSGSYNTVLVNSNQINNGNQTVIINGTACGAASCPTTTSTTETQVLNGGLNF
jgi:holdfast attachment protein HfaA